MKLHEIRTHFMSSVDELDQECNLQALILSHYVAVKILK